MKLLERRSFTFEFVALNRKIVTHAEREQLLTWIMETGAQTVDQVVQAGYVGLENNVIVTLESFDLNEIEDARLRIIARFPGAGSWKIKGVSPFDT